MRTLTGFIFVLLTLMACGDDNTQATAPQQEQRAIERNQENVLVVDKIIVGDPHGSHILLDGNQNAIYIMNASECQVEVSDNLNIGPNQVPGIQVGSTAIVEKIIYWNLPSAEYTSFHARTLKHSSMDLIVPHKIVAGGFTDYNPLGE